MSIANERLKLELLAERKRLAEQVDQLNNSTTISPGETIGYGTHQADHATEAFEQAKELAIRQNSESLLRQVEAALARFEQGTYGLCTECGKPINPERLEALPYASLCIECQLQMEGKG